MTWHKSKRQYLMYNKWVSLLTIRAPEHGINGYVYSHETRCNGLIVAVMPFSDDANNRRYLLKSEVTPCWSLDPVISAITGGYEGDGFEGEDIEDDAVREVLEETGYAITRDDLIPLGTCYASKSSDTIYSLFSVDLTGQTAGVPTGDGSRLEAEATAVWLEERSMIEVMDPQVSVMFLRLTAMFNAMGPK